MLTEIAAITAAYQMLKPGNPWKTWKIWISLVLQILEKSVLVFQVEEIRANLTVSNPDR